MWWHDNRADCIVGPEEPSRGASCNLVVEANCLDLPTDDAACYSGERKIFRSDQVNRITAHCRTHSPVKTLRELIDGRD
ncbi:MAG TPA: hypothetical protein VGI40_27735 [Pirellulaceae bacterium]|jgi:hypothetical protein